MTEIKLDPRAASALDERAKEVLDHVVRQEPKRRTPSWQPDIDIKTTLTEADIIGDIDTGLSTPDGKRISLQFSHEGSLYVVEGPGYERVDQLVIALLKCRDVRMLISERTVEETVRRWIRQRFRGETAEAFSSFAIASLGPIVGRFEVWVPIERLYVEQPFQLGHCEIKPVAREMIEHIVSAARKHDDSKEAGTRFRKYQGHAAIVMSVEGEPRKAEETARAEAEKILAALSLLSPAALKCTIASAASLWGSKRTRSSAAFLFRDGQINNSTEGQIGPPLQSQVVDRDRLNQFRTILRALHFVLLAESANKLAAKIVDALRVYFRGISSPDAAEKLIYVFVSLEMILLRDANEPVQDNIATRIAFLIGNSVEERRSIITAVKTGYSLRSAFVHHGVQVQDTTAADEMLEIAWQTLVELISTVQRHSEVNELVRELEDRKLR